MDFPQEYLTAYESRYRDRLNAYMERHPQNGEVSEVRLAEQKRDYLILLMLVHGGRTPEGQAAWVWVVSQAGPAAAKTASEWKNRPLGYLLQQGDILSCAHEELLRQIVRSRKELDAASPAGSAEIDSLGETRFRPHKYTWHSYMSILCRQAPRIIIGKIEILDPEGSELKPPKPPKASSGSTPEALDPGLDTSDSDSGLISHEELQRRALATALQQGFLSSVEISAYAAGVGLLVPLQGGAGGLLKPDLEVFSKFLHAGHDYGDVDDAGRIDKSRRLRERKDTDFAGVSARLFVCQVKNNCGDDRELMSRLRQAKQNGWLSASRMIDLCGHDGGGAYAVAGYLFEEPELRKERLCPPENIQVGGVKGTILAALVNFHAAWLFDTPPIGRACETLVGFPDLAAFCAATAAGAARRPEVRAVAAGLPTSGEAILKDLGVKPRVIGESVRVKRVDFQRSIELDLLSLARSVFDMRREVIGNARLYDDAVATISEAPSAKELLRTLRAWHETNKGVLTAVGAGAWLHGKKAPLERLWKVVHFPPQRRCATTLSWELYAACRGSRGGAADGLLPRGVEQVLRLAAAGRGPVAAEPRFGCRSCGAFFVSREEFLAHKTERESCRQ